MATFDEYRNQYKHVQMERRSGILQLTLHTDGKTLRWGEGPHSELGKCFYDVGSDPENRAVIITGTEDKFNCPLCPRGQWEITPNSGIIFIGRQEALDEPSGH